MPNKLKVLVVCLTSLLVGNTYAQSTEAEWRVMNDITPSIVPPVAIDIVNPFPTVKAVEVAEIVEQPQDEKTLEEKLAAEIIEEARKIITSNQAYTPDIEKISFQGSIDGLRGKKVLYHNTWLTEGGHLDAPIKGATAAYEVLKRLEGIDAEMANTLREELNSKVVSQGSMKLKIIRIMSDEVVLSEGKRQYKIKVSQAD